MHCGDGVIIPDGNDTDVQGLFTIRVIYYYRVIGTIWVIRIVVAICVF